MNIDAHTIDDIVAGVLKQLGTATNVRAEKQSDNQILLDATVITEDLLRDQVSGVGHLLLRADAIITPSGRDWLRQQKISWERSSQDQNKQQSTLMWRLILVETSSMTVQLAEAGDSLKWHVDRAGNPSAAMELVVSILNQNQTGGVVVVSEQPERIACQANRNLNVRAAVVHSVEDVKRIQQQLGANLIVISSSERSYFELSHLLKAISAGGPPIEPADW